MIQKAPYELSPHGGVWRSIDSTYKLKRAQMSMQANGRGVGGGEGGVGGKIIWAPVEGGRGEGGAQQHCTQAPST